MRKLEISDRGKIEEFFNSVHLKTFYHYFPLLYAISESDSNLYYEDKNPPVLVTKDIYYYWNETFKPKEVNYFVSSIKTNDTILYDVNYIYELKNTIDIGNFKANVKKFEQRNTNYGFSTDYDLGLEVIKNWYLRRQGDFTDFGYTLWLTQNFRLFSDLRPHLVTLDGKPVAFSLWGKINDLYAVHIVSKDRGIPYLQDWLRMQIYKEMIDEGIIWCNDGGNCDSHELEQYKLKLRPKFIIPVWRSI